MNAFSLRLTRWSAALLLVALLASLAPPAFARPAAQSSGLTMFAQVAFEGNFKYGEWLPVWADLENSGSDLRGEVQVRVASTNGAMVYAVPVSLPAGSHKRVPVYVLPNNFTRELEVKLVSGKDALATQTVKLRPQANITYLIGLVAPQRGALTLLNGITLPGQERPKVLVDIPLSDIPERVEGLQSFDALVINDTDTSTLTPEQAAALDAWVRGGGRLVLGGGAGAQRTVAGLPQSLAAARPGAAVEVGMESLAGLAQYAASDPVKVPGQYLAAYAPDKNARTLAGDPAQPLVQEASLGQGFVDYVALDLSASPFDAWSGAAAFWEALLGPGASYPLGMPPDASVRQIRGGSIPYALSNMPVLDLPSVKGLALLLAFYILLVGPANYLFLKWRKKLHWAWITIPAITAVFSAGAFGIGYAMHGSDLVLNKIAVVEVQPGGSAAVTSYLGLFSPGQGSYQIEVQGSNLVSPVSSYSDPWGGANPSLAGQEMTFVQSDPSVLRGLSVNQFSMQSFVSEETWPDFGQISADLTLNGSGISGVVRNGSSHNLSDAVLILGKRFVRLGDLAAGAEVQANLNLGDVESQRFGPPLSYMIFQQAMDNPGPTGPDRTVELKRSILETIFERGIMAKMSSSSLPGSVSLGLTLIGWMDQAPPEITISGQQPAQQTTALVMAPLDYRLADTQRLSLPTGFIPGTMIKSPQEGGYCGDASTAAVYLVRGDADFEFQAPDLSQAYSVDTIRLSLWTDSGWWSAPRAYLYDWQAQDWSEVKDPIQGENTVQEAARFVDSSNRVRVRLSSDSAMQGCFYLGVGLDAARQSGGSQ